MRATDCLYGVDDGCGLLSTVGTSSNSGGSVCICLSHVLGVDWWDFEGGEAVYILGVSESDTVQSLCWVERAIRDSGVLKRSFRVFPS